MGAAKHGVAVGGGELLFSKLQGREVESKRSRFGRSPEEGVGMVQTSAVCSL